MTTALPTAALTQYEMHDGAATITMDDGKVNVMSMAMIGRDSRTRSTPPSTTTHRGAGRSRRVFSAGFDLATLRGGAFASSTMVRGRVRAAARGLEFPRPAVAACTGHAIAMGTFLLCSTDVRISADGDFRFAANEVAIGLDGPPRRNRAAPGEVDAVHVGASHRVRRAVIRRALCPPASSTRSSPPTTCSPSPVRSPPRRKCSMRNRSRRRNNAVGRPPSAWCAMDRLRVRRVPYRDNTIHEARAKQRTPELRDRILHVAPAAFAHDGTDGLTARRIARDADTSIPAVYELFGDKAGRSARSSTTDFGGSAPDSLRLRQHPTRSSICARSFRRYGASPAKNPDSSSSCSPARSTSSIPRRKNA